MTDLLHQLQTALDGRYEIVRALGAGGMATVYLAEDLKHGRKVAIKVLREELSASLGKERFLREIKLAAGLQHPHVLPLYDSGEADGRLFYVMPYVAGMSLRDKLNGPQRPVLGEAVRILRDIAAALGEAHDHGVVHRDIKPENVLLSGGTAVVADFGIAKAVSASRTAAGATLTSAGTALGTPAYMAPEQAAGDEVDSHADLYAWGVIAYELLTGTHPFPGKTTAQQLIGAHLSDTPVPVRERNPAVPATLASLVGRCLEKDPARRPRNASELIRKLDGLSVPSGETAMPAKPSAATNPRSRRVALIAGGVLVAAALGAIGLLATRSQRATADRKLTIVAVLPFENASGDSTQNYFAEGMADEISSALGTLRIDDLRLIARSSAYAVRGRATTPQEIGRLLGATAIVQGRVRRAGDRLTVTAELANVADGTQQWSHAYEERTVDVFDVQHRIASAIVGALQLTLRPAISGANHYETSIPEAHDLNLRARYLMTNVGTRPAIDTALQLFRRAVELDPQYAAALVGMATGYVTLGDAYAAPTDVNPKGLALLRRALAIDSSHADAWGLAAWIDVASEHDSARAQHEIERAKAIDPTDTWTSFAEGLYHFLFTKNNALALSTVQHQTIYNPLEPLVPNIAGTMALLVGLPDTALVYAARMHEIKPGYEYLESLAGWAYLMKGMYDEADREYAASGCIVARPCAGPAVLRVKQGRRAEALAIVRSLEAEWQRAYIDPAFVTWAYAALGDTEHMYIWAQRTVDVHSTNGYVMELLPEFAAYRAEPRLRELIRAWRAPHTSPTS